VTVGADVVGIGVNAIVVQVLLEWFVGESVGFDRCQTIGADVVGDGEPVDARDETAAGVRRKNRADTSEKIDLDRYLDKPRHSTRKQTFVHKNYVF
jgi:hypothetical protein